MRLSEIMRLRNMIEKAAASLSDDDALEAPELYPEWEVGKTYKADDRRRYGEKLYKCVQGHTSQADWTPDVVPALWTEVTPEGVIDVWKQPTGAHDAYKIGAKVHYPTMEDPIYINTVDNNIYAPDVYGWDLVE